MTGITIFTTLRVLIDKYEWIKGGKVTVKHNRLMFRILII